VIKLGIQLVRLISLNAERKLSIVTTEKYDVLTVKQEKKVIFFEQNEKRFLTIPDFIQALFNIWASAYTCSKSEVSVT
jgi:hypothetical protein